MLLVSELDASFYEAGDVCRAVVELPDGQRLFEAPRVPQRELHRLSDCGSKGFIQGLWNCARGKVLGLSSDVRARDMSNSVKRALVRTGLGLLVLEWGLVANFREAPPHITRMILSGFPAGGV